MEKEKLDGWRKGWGTATLMGAHAQFGFLPVADYLAAVNSIYMNALMDGKRDQDADRGSISYETPKTNRTLTIIERDGSASDSDGSPSSLIKVIEQGHNGMRRVYYARQQWK